MEDSIAANLGSNIRQLREARGLTQQQMAKLSGVPRPTWANLESGAANPTLAILIKVAGALQVRVEEARPPVTGVSHGLSASPSGSALGLAYKPDQTS